MTIPMLVAPLDLRFGNANTMKAPTEETQKLADLGRRLWELTNLCDSVDYGQAYRDACRVTSTLRALRALMEIVAEQPGYPVGHPKRRELRAAMKPLRDKVEELGKAVEQACNPVNPIPKTAPKVVSSKQGYAGQIAAILNETKNAELIASVKDDKSIPAQWKEEFFQCLGYRMQAATEAVLRAGGHDEEVMRPIEEAVLSARKESMIGALLAATAAGAVPIGNLPGPDSFFVAVVRLRSLWTLGKIANDSTKIPAAFHEISSHLTKALRFTADEEAAFRKTVVDMKRDPAKTTPEKVEAARKQAIKMIGDKCSGFHAGPVYSWAISVLNVISLLGAIHGVKDFSDMTLQNYVDLGNAAIASATGAGAAAGRSLPELALLQKSRLAIVKKLADACEKVGTVVSVFAAITAIVDGGMTFSDGLEAKDPWKISAGGLQFCSGVLIAAGVLFEIPGAQPIGVVVGAIAIAINLTSAIIEASKDPTKRVVLQLIKQIREAKCTFDGTVIVETLKLQDKVDEIQKLAEDADISLVVLDVRSGGVPGRYMDVVNSLLDTGFGDKLSLEMVKYR
ncbi:MAG: hypothetical protein QM820_28965 [Minicystis sp.]